MGPLEECKGPVGPLEECRWRRRGRGVQVEAYILWAGPVLYVSP